MSRFDLTQHFVGTSTVGERGQVVIPAEAREKLGIKPGDKLLVLIHPMGYGVDFVKLDKLQEALQEMQRVVAMLGRVSSEAQSEKQEE